MFLVVDVGNSHTVTGMYDGKTLVGQWRLNSDRKSTADELAVRYRALFSMEGISSEDIESVVISSVVPTLESAWITCCEKYFGAQHGKNLFAVRYDKIEELITIRLANPAEVGADRLVNAIAAWSQHRCNLIIIDFGTAITFDCVTDSCEYLGGSIVPGIAISLEALASRTARLPHIDVSEPPPGIIGKTTVQAMRSGILYGYGAMIDGLVHGIRKEMIGNEDIIIRIVATGGMAKLIRPYSKVIDEIDPLLTLKGLALIHDKILV